MKSDLESGESLMSGLKLKLHPIIRNFPVCISYFAVFRALFVQDRIRVIDVDQDTPAARRRVKLPEQTVRSRKRNVADFPSLLCAHAGGNQFVIMPERSVEQAKIARLGPLF